MKNAVFWDVRPCGSCKNRCFGGMYHLIIRVKRCSKLEITSAVTVMLVNLVQGSICSLI
jgi:hypothetical protein